MGGLGRVGRWSDGCRAPGRRSSPDSGAEARVKRPNLLQAWGFVGTLGGFGLPLDARRTAPLLTEARRRREGLASCARAGRPAAPRLWQAGGWLVVCCRRGTA